MKKRLKVMVGAVVALVSMLVMQVNVMATTSTIDLADVIGAGFTSVVGEIMSIVVVILPIGLGLVGLFIAIRRGIGLFRSMTRG